MKSIFHRMQLKRYDQALHHQCQNKIYRLVTSGLVPCATLHLEQTLLDEWCECIGLEAKLQGRVRRSTDTIQLQKLRQARTWYVSRIFYLIRSSQNAPEHHLREAALVLMTVVDAYKGLRKSAASVTTGKVSGLILNMKKEDVAAAVQVLGLDEYLTKLERTNNEVLATQAQRSDERAAERLPTSVRARVDTDRCCGTVLSMIQSSYTLCKSPETKAQIAHLVAGINQRIKECEESHHKSLAQRRAARKRGSAMRKPQSVASMSRPTGSGRHAATSMVKAKGEGVENASGPLYTETPHIPEQSPSLRRWSTTAHRGKNGAEYAEASHYSATPEAVGELPTIRSNQSG